MYKECGLLDTWSFTLRDVRMHRKFPNRKPQLLTGDRLTGLPPFYDENTNEMYKKIVEEPLKFPSHEIVPAAARDLLTGLLDRDPQRRLGANGAGEIKAHCFFSNIDWRKLLMRRYEPTFKPNVVRVCLSLT